MAVVEPGAGREAIVSVKGVTKTFGRVRALKGVDLDLPAGRVLGLLGPNGAGKTTLVRIMTTLLKPDKGEVTIAGYDIRRDGQAIRSVIGLAGQYAAVDEDLTGAENLHMVGRLYHLDSPTVRHRASELLERFTLTHAAHRPVKTYSGGMRRRLDLAASLLARPLVLFLDEPTSGLDPRSRRELWEIIRELVADGTSLLLTTQNMEEADHLADTIAVIDNGAVVALGTPDQLKMQSGGDVLQVTLADPSRLEQAQRIVAALGTKEPQVDPVLAQISLPIQGGTQVLVEAIRRLDEPAIEIADIVLRRPSLDDVFLALTGHAADDEATAPKPVRRFGKPGKTKIGGKR